MCTNSYSMTDLIHAISSHDDFKSMKQCGKVHIVIFIDIQAVRKFLSRLPTIIIVTKGIYRTSSHCFSGWNARGNQLCGSEFPYLQPLGFNIPKYGHPGGRSVNSWLMVEDMTHLTRAIGSRDDFNERNNVTRFIHIVIFIEMWR